jgi:hypothetical protein
VAAPAAWGIPSQAARAAGSGSAGLSRRYQQRFRTLSKSELSTIRTAVAEPAKRAVNPSGSARSEVVVQSNMAVKIMSNAAVSAMAGAATDGKERLGVGLVHGDITGQPLSQQCAALRCALLGASLFGVVCWASLWSVHFSCMP